MEPIRSIVPEEVFDENVHRTQDFEEVHGKIRKKQKRHSGKGYDSHNLPTFPTTKKKLAELKTPPIEGGDQPHDPHESDEYRERMEYEPAGRQELEAVRDMNREVEEQQAQKIDQETPFISNEQTSINPTNKSEAKEIRDTKKEEYFGLSR